MALGTGVTLQRMAANLAALNNQHVERFLAQMEFAAGLADLLGRKASAWAKPMDRAWRTVERAVTAGSPSAIAGAVAEAEKALAPIGRVAKTYTIHCVGHGHIDMNWMWSWPETVAVTNDTFLTVLALMDEFDDFCYTQSQASVYAIMRDYSPELLARIKRRIRQGRWEVAASHWVEGDRNMASGEALARHLLYTRRFCREVLGLEPDDVRIDWSPDTFGHAATIPSIDARGGVKYYYMCRGGQWNKPPVFWWQGPDGSRILVNLETTWYNDHVGPHNATAMLKFCAKTGIRDWMNVYGVGDHGGGPTRRDILRCREMNAWPIYPNFRLATTRDYYKILESHGRKWSVVDAELNYEFAGCYTTQTQIKRNNRYGENHMVEAETAATLADRVLDRPYPAQALRDNWIEVLFGHFHDILPGSGVRETRHYSGGQFQRIAAATSMIKTHALRGIAARVDTSFAGKPERSDTPPGSASIAIGAGAGRGAILGAITSAGHVLEGPRPFVIFNPTAWARGETVLATIWDADASAAPVDLGKREFVVRAADGRAIPAQNVNSGNYWGHKFVDLAFPAEVGSLGYNTYVIEEGKVEGFDAPVKFVEPPKRHEPFAPPVDPVMENEHLRVRFDSLTGGVISLIDKASGKDLAGPADALGVLEYVHEQPLGMSAWVIAPTQERQCPLPLTSFKPVLRGPHVASVEAKLKVRNSDVTVTYTLRAGQPWLEIHVQARWVEIGTPQTGTPTLKIRFPLALAGAKGLYEIPFGAIERDLNRGEEVPSLRWADVTGTLCGRKAAGRAKVNAAGCAVLNDSKYGHSLEGSTFRVTLIRSSYEPDPIPEVGDHSVRFAVMPHGARPPVADLIRAGAAFNHPLQVVATDVHDGVLPAAADAIPNVAPASVVLSSLKKAEDEDAFVVRLFETAGKAATARLAFSPLLLGKVTQAVEVDLLERPLANSTAAVTRDGFGVRVPARGIASVKLRLSR